MATVISATEIIWATGTDPAPQDVTVPADCTAAYMFYTFWADAGSTDLTSVTLEAVSPDQTLQQTGTGTLTASGVAAWYNPGTGANQTVDVTWNNAPVEGATTVIVFVKDGNTTAWRNAQADQNTSTTAVSVTLTTVSGDLVLKYDEHYDVSETVPALTSGWTNAVTTGNVDEGARLSYITATGTTQVCDAEDESFSTITAISIESVGRTDVNYHGTNRGMARGVLRGVG